MKNLFKNLMLVAVAAMAFVACQNEPEMVINGGEKTTITFDAKFDDTRSYFGEKVEGAYPSFWTGNEVAVFTHTSYCYGDGVNYVDVELDGNDARFVVEFYGQNPNPGAEIVAVTPVSAWTIAPYYDFNISSYSPIGWKHTCTVPSEQTPTATSVDEKAHILKAAVTYAGENSMELLFQHQVAYGRFSVKNLELEAGDSVDNIVLNINGAKYILTTDAAADVWFACAPATVENMTITLKTVGGVAYTKTLVENSDKTLAFVQGQVSAFTVNMEGVGTGEVFDPDYLMAAPVFNGEHSNGPCFEFDYVNNSYTYTVRIWLAAENRSNNTMAVGSYTGNGAGSGTDSYSPSASQFAATIYDSWGRVSGCYARHFTSASTLTVSFENDVYTVVLEHNGTTYGYKGMPEGWAAPGVVKTKLATPSVRATAEGNVVTIDFDYIEGAGNYTISGLDQTYTVTGTTNVYELAYSTTYNISVVANPANAETHKASDAGTATVTTEADPNAEPDPEQPEQPGDAKVVTLTYFANTGTTDIFQGDDGRNYLIAFKNLASMTTGTYDLSDNKTFYVDKTGYTNSNSEYWNVASSFAAGDTLEFTKSTAFTIVIKAKVAGEDVVATCASFSF